MSKGVGHGRRFDAGDGRHIQATGCPHTVVVEAWKVKQVVQHLERLEPFLPVFIRSVHELSRDLQTVNSLFSSVLTTFLV